MKTSMISKMITPTELLREYVKDFDELEDYGNYGENHPGYKILEDNWNVFLEEAKDTNLNGFQHCLHSVLWQYAALFNDADMFTDFFARMTNQLNNLGEEDKKHKKINDPLF